ncbi:DNA cytosine methyltransferase [Jiangella alkaliphila]|uniref:DNA cytosine methyltransferase n=1 Tax=Jiangella alkaliphila TaxID=419479 RepID=UPI00069AF01F|nr:DNA cytosine methyltransferase [Jiangella alkaliphila]
MARQAGVVELFAGPGGWSEGLRSLDVADVVGIDNDPDACATATAAGHRRVCADVSVLDPFQFGRVRGVVASPPCTTFSSAGSGLGRHLVGVLSAAVAPVLNGAISITEVAETCRQLLKRVASIGDDEGVALAAAISVLVLEPARWVAALSPDWVVMEQVRAVGPIWDAYTAALRDFGYGAWSGVLNAADYGVPQDRRRRILIAARGRTPHPPPPTHAQHPEPPNLIGPGRRRWVSMADALGDADGHRAAYRRTRGAGWTTRHGARPDRPTDQPAPSITSKARSDTWHCGRVSLRTDTRPGRGGRPRPTRGLDQPAPTLVFGKRLNAVSWVLDRRSVSTDRCGTRYPTPPVQAGRPAPTLTGKSGGQWLRRCTACPGSRRITIAEASVLQGFAPDYPWQGSATRAFAQIGNAVPPRFAAAILGQALPPGAPR